MSSTDWDFLTGVLTQPQCDRGVTIGIPRPNGGGNYVFGFNSQDIVTGAVALATNQVDFAPLVSGGTIRGAVQRGISGGTENFAPFLYLGLQGQAVSNHAYLLGLSDAYPHHIVLKKGALNETLEDDAPGVGSPILLRSTKAYEPGIWHHLRLDMIVQGSGDTLLQVYRNDLALHTVTSPVWEIVGGMEGPFAPTFYGYVDDSLGVNTGSQPFTGGRAGYGFFTSDTQRRGFFDHLQIGRQ